MMLSSREQYKSLFSALGRRVVERSGTLWTVYHGMVQPLGPVSERYVLSPEESADLRSELQGFLVRYTDGFDTTKGEDWYSVVCEEFYGMDDCRSKERKKIRKALRECVVQRISADELSEKGFDVYVKAHHRYKEVATALYTKKQFFDQHRFLGLYPDIIQVWGVFVEGVLVGYSINYLFDKEEVHYSVVKLDPDFLRLGSSLALFYTMNEFYLNQEKVKYVNAGFRNILHDTQIQEFLIRYFGFRKALTRLTVDCSWWLKGCLMAARPFHQLLKRPFPRFAALQTLWGVSHPLRRSKELLVPVSKPGDQVNL